LSTLSNNTPSRASNPRLLSKDKIYSMKTASQGSVIGPSHGSPNSSSDIFRSSTKIMLSRYPKGTMNLFLSEVYTTKWPLSATDVLHALESSCASICAVEALLPKEATLCHFLAISISFLGLTISDL